VIDGKGGGDVTAASRAATICGRRQGQDLRGYGADTLSAAAARTRSMARRAATALSSTGCGGGRDPRLCQQQGDDDTLLFDDGAFGSLGREADGTGKLLDKYFQSSFASVAESATARFLYERDTGLLRYDADGTGAKEAKIIASFNNFIDLQVSDFIIV
jgi:hypothetical protein